jgi:hypothetical protein
MLSPELPIVADARNYNPELEPTLSAVPPEQQVSSSRATLDNLPPAAALFLRFRLRSIEEITPASCSSFVEEIVQHVMEAEGRVEWVETALQFMSEIFDKAGRLLSRQRRGDKGKGKEHAQ